MLLSLQWMIQGLQVLQRKLCRFLILSHWSLLLQTMGTASLSLDRVLQWLPNFPVMSQGPLVLQTEVRCFLVQHWSVFLLMMGQSALNLHHFLQLLQILPVLSQASLMLHLKVNWSQIL